MLFIEFNMPGKTEKQMSLTERLAFKKYQLRVPKNVEILGIFTMRCDMIQLDLSECKDSLKQVELLLVLVWVELLDIHAKRTFLERGSSGVVFGPVHIHHHVIDPV